MVGVIPVKLGRNVREMEETCRKTDDYADAKLIPRGGRDATEFSNRLSIGQKRGSEGLKFNTPED